jgi:hypothetical protein
MELGISDIKTDPAVASAEFLSILIAGFEPPCTHVNLPLSFSLSLSLFLSFSLFLSLSLSLLCAMQLDQINHNFAILLQFFNFLVTSLNHRANACPCFHPRVPSICQRQKINKIDHQWPTKSAESPFSQI